MADPEGPLAKVASRIARAVAEAREYEMRNLKRCSCTRGWRVVGHEYDTNGCIESLERAQVWRDMFETSDAALSEEES